MKWTRNDFLKSLGLLPLGAATSTLFTGSSNKGVSVNTLTHSKFEPWVEIYPENMKHNVREIHRAAGNRPVLATIKNNGYGMGVVESAHILDQMDEVSGLAVVKLNEAVRLREAGISKPILLLSLTEGRELEEVVRRDITPMIYTEIGRELEALARKLQRPIPVEVKLDTGLSRLGVHYRKAPDYYRDLASRDGISIQGSFITFTESEDFDREMIRRYNGLMSQLSSAGLNYGKRHAVSTTPIFRHPEAHYDQVRPGIGLYGIYPYPDVQRRQGLMELKPAFGLKCRVVDVKKLQKGDSAGYGQAFVAEEETWLATLPIGHADGWQRSAAGCAKIRIGEQLYPVVASVSASHTLVNLGAQTGVKIGDEAVIYDDREGSRPDDINRACGTSTYDLLMHVSPTLRRIIADR
jgi:alanine racemase